METVACQTDNLFCTNNKSFFFPSGSSQYIKVGCFKDNTRQRALPDLLGSDRGNLNWNSSLSYVVKKCAKETKKNNFMYFG